MSSVASAVLNYHVPREDSMEHHDLSDVLCRIGIGGDVGSATIPDLPSLLRNQNRRFLMNRIDTTTIPDFKTLTDITFDHDIYTAIQMISFDTITGFKIGGRSTMDVLVDELELLDEVVDLSEIYREVVFDELRFGNAIVRKNFKTAGGRRLMTTLEIIHPGKIVNMEVSPYNKPMWWVFEKFDENSSFFMNPGRNVAYVDLDYREQFKSSGYSDADIVGLASDIVHFKGCAPVYQKWGVGLAQIAKILVEAKLDMLVDFSKIIKREAATREIVFVDVKGLDKGKADTKIANTVTELNKQRKAGAIMVLGKKGQEDALDVKVVGSEGKVLDNFSLHYRDDILRAIRILTRIPPSFWLGESTNKATINSQLIVYNRFLKSQRWYGNKRFAREVNKPYLEQQTNRKIRLKELPEFLFTSVTIEDPMDRAIIDDIAIRNGSKSRKQVADEQGYILPEDDGLVAPSLSGGSEMGTAMVEEIHKEMIGVERNV